MNVCLHRNEEDKYGYDGEEDTDEGEDSDDSNAEANYRNDYPECDEEDIFLADQEAGGYGGDFGSDVEINITDAYRSGYPHYDSDDSSDEEEYVCDGGDFDMNASSAADDESHTK